MPAPAILAIDQGTTNTKIVLLDQAGTIVASASRAMELSHPQPGWAEQSAEAIWESVTAAIAEIVAATPDYTVAAIGISNQRETIVLWDAATGRPVGPAISWQCRRSSDECARLRADGHEPIVVAKTGLKIDPLFSASKLGWLLRALPAAQDRSTLRAGTVDSWLLWNLTGGAVHATDHSNAARTQLFNLRDVRWDEELADLFGVPLAILPEIRSSDSRFGTVAEGRTALPAGVPIQAMIGDSHAALFAHTMRGTTAVKVTIGTGSSIMTPVDRLPTSLNGLSGTVAWSRGGRVTYGLEGNIIVSGRGASYITTMLGLKDVAALIELAGTVEDSDGVVFVPALAGLGAPHWQDRARGLITGLTLRSTPAHVARAALDAITLQISDVFLSMEADVGHSLAAISVDGGASRSNALLQLLADILDRSVTRMTIAEASALGAALMAADALGWSVPPPPAASADDIFVPGSTPAERDAKRAQWAAALRRAAPDL